MFCALQGPKIAGVMYGLGFRVESEGNEMETWVPCGVYTDNHQYLLSSVPCIVIV